MSTWKRMTGFAARRLAPLVEALERREMLDAGFGVISGTAFVDSAGSGLLDPSDAYLPGATVQLEKVSAGALTPVASATTDAYGGYSFQGLAPGTYEVVETPPRGYTARGTQVQSQLMPGSGFAPNGVVVSVPQGNQVDLNYGGVKADAYQVMNNLINGTPLLNGVGPLRISLGTAPGKADLGPGFLSFCLDDLQRISFGGGEQYQVVPKAITALTDVGATVSPDRAGRIAFLFNHFGNTSLTGISGPALQLAIWELLYDTNPNPDFSAGNFQVVGPQSPTGSATLAEVMAQARAFFNASAGKREAAVLLDAGGAIRAESAGGHQSMIASGSFNFANARTSTPPVRLSGDASLSGYVYCDDNRDAAFDAGDAPLAGVTVTLNGATDAGVPVTLATTTDATGAYHFPGLQPGSYTLTEARPAGFLDGAVTQGTPGDGVVVSRSIADIRLNAGVDGRDNDFGEIDVPVTVSRLTLDGIHHQTTRIVLQFSGPLDAAQAGNPANYTLNGLGKDERLGTADDRRVGIGSAVYNPSDGTVTLTPDRHLNIHYHYVLSLNVLSGDPCPDPVTFTAVFGRSAEPVWDWHGRLIPAPRMLPWEVRHNQQVVGHALDVLQHHPSAIAGATVRRGHPAGPHAVAAHHARPR